MQPTSENKARAHHKRSQQFLFMDSDNKACSRLREHTLKTQRKNSATYVRQALENRFGEALIKAHLEDKKVLDEKLLQLDKEKARQQATIDKAIRKFRIENALELPTLILERQPTMEARLRYIHRNSILSKPYNYDDGKPRFMRATSSHARIKSTFATIDAFSQVTSKKSNVWETTLADHETPRFRCAVPPVTPLTIEERNQLEECLWKHRDVCIFDTSPEQKKLEKERRKKLRQRSAPAFITQMRDTHFATAEGDDKLNDLQEGEKYPLTVNKVMQAYLSNTSSSKQAKISCEKETNSSTYIDNYLDDRVQALHLNKQLHDKVSSFVRKQAGEATTHQNYFENSDKKTLRNELGLVS